MSSTTYRIAVGGIAHETHSFTTRPTGLEDFRKQALFFGDEILVQLAGGKSATAGMIDNAGDGWQLLPTTYAGAMPGGVVTSEAFETIVGELTTRLAQAMPLDGVLLALHGAMVTERELDAESAILQAVRDVVGSGTPIVITLDMHGNISQRTVDLVDVLIAFDENPHIDPYDRGREAADVMEQLLSGAVKPTAGYAHPSLILAPQATGTADLPLSAVHERAAEMETEDAVICVSVFGGFAYSDTPDAGTSLIVATDNDPDLAQRYADELADLLMANRDAALPDFVAADVAVQQALAMPGRPIVLVDSADNIGGGTPGDGTDALRAMLDAGVVDGTVVIADPQAVAICWDAGESGLVEMEVGGKYDEWHGAPVPVTGAVQRLSEGTFTAELANNHFASFFGNTIRMGRTAWLRSTAGDSSVNIVLTERKTPPFDLAQLRSVGVIPEEQKMIAVKSAVAYRAAYLPIAAGVIEMDTAGLCSANLDRFPYRHVRRPIMPLDDM
jgi:microcystin degradation protein MlrC